MKYLALTFDKLEKLFTAELGFVLRNELSTGTFRVFKLPKVGRRHNYLVLDGLESSEHCGFVAYCYSSQIDSFNKDYLATDLPAETGFKEVAAFDIRLLDSKHGIVWSLYNEQLDRRFDGVFRGSEERIRERAGKIITIVLKTVRESLLPFLKTVEINRN